MNPTSDELPCDDSAVSAPPPGPSERPRTLFVHVPKSGGTTLDGIFRDHYVGTPLYPSLWGTKFGDVLAQINDPANAYVGGHYPLAAFQADSFDVKVTTLRNPLDIIYSRLSFANKIANEPPEHRSPAEVAGRKKRVYEPFYTPHFDLERLTIDSNYGIALGLQQYVGLCSVDEVIAELETFDHVLDFDRLDDEIKALLIEKGFFPYRDIPKKRAYSYVPDRERADRLLCDFDRSFYEIASRQFRDIPGDIESRYEQYRADYCEARGIDLQVHQGRSLDLRGPVGSGWFNVEASDKGTPFRWSEDRHATVEIPVAQAGVYGVYLYLTPAVIEGFRLTACTTLGARTFPVTKVGDNGVQVYAALVATTSHDWIQFEINIDKSSGDTSVPKHGDVRSLGVALGHAYIIRHPG